MTTIRVGLRTGTSKIVKIDKPFHEILQVDVIEKVKAGILGWAYVDGEMSEHVTVKKCCLICDHAVIEDIDDLDNLIPCNCQENMTEHGGSPCMEQDDVCEHFMLNSILAQE